MVIIVISTPLKVMGEVDKQSESDLLQQVAKSNEDAFRKLFDSYQKKIYSTALKLTADSSLSEEIVQDTFLKVWIKREQLPEILNFESWVYVIARNLIFTAIKDLQKEKKNLLDLAREKILEEYRHTDFLAQEKDFDAILFRAIERLPIKQKNTYVLIKQQLKKRDEVAAELGVTSETVKSNLDMAMKNIRAYCLTHLDEIPRIFLIYLFASRL